MKTIDQPSDCCFVLQINDVVKIQAFIRANKARDDYKTLSEYDPNKCYQRLVSSFGARLTLKMSSPAQSAPMILPWPW